MSDRGEADARRRHPSAAFVPDHERLRRLLAVRLAAEGHPRPVLGATALALRGVLRSGRAELAGALGLSIEALAAVEDGAAPGADWPAAAGGSERLEHGS